jgi:hypothetical protein
MVTMAKLVRAHAAVVFVHMLLVRLVFAHWLVFAYNLTA